MRAYRLLGWARRLRWASPLFRIACRAAAAFKEALKHRRLRIERAKSEKAMRSFRMRLRATDPEAGAVHAARLGREPGAQDGSNQLVNACSPGWLTS